MIYAFVVHIGRKAGLSDPEGTTTGKALRDLGFRGVGNVAFGRTITLEIDADSQDAARIKVDEMCQKLLANPVMEHYTIEAVS
ncbi:MAG: phosphoribosylformylglycinamidine synthase subunit PurS [Acidimicrobiia bacterium]|nr:MAG: phosphoribosylformylglycinamidine synthase subunit PurS [Acidimicrobiia bacterium]